MSPKYFLVGKVLSSYRFVLLLLSLSIPVAAMCVVLGGATWQDVLSTYVLISLHGLIYMSISVPIAVMTARPVTTVVWSYGAGFVYFVLMSLTGLMSMGMRAAPVHPLIGLSPTSTAEAGGLVTDIFGAKVPVWIPAAVVALLFLRMMVLGAASALTQAGSKETFNLRLSGAVFCLVGAWLLGLGSGGSARIPLSTGGPDLAMAVWTLSLFFLVFLPYVSTWAAGGGAKAWPNGWWKLKLTLRGTPASGLPFLVLLLVCLSIGALVVPITTGAVQPVSFLYLAGVFGMWALAWSLGWAASAMVWRTGVEACRKLHVLFLFVVFVLPLVLLGFLEMISQYYSWPVKPGWTQQINPFGFLGDKADVAAIKVAVIFVMAASVWFLAERRRAVAVESMRSAT